LEACNARILVRVLEAELEDHVFEHRSVVELEEAGRRVLGHKQTVPHNSNLIESRNE
jgi:hypothetical protein